MLTPTRRVLATLALAAAFFTLGALGPASPSTPVPVTTTLATR